MAKSGRDVEQRYTKSKKETLWVWEWVWEWEWVWVWVWVWGGCFRGYSVVCSA